MPDKPVLLVMDVQRGIVDRFADDHSYLERLVGAIAAARANAVPAVYAVAPSAPAPRDQPAQPDVRRGRRRGRLHQGTPATDIHPDRARPDDPVVTKRRVSAFAGSDLEVLLRGLEADTLVLAA